jgi:hypothetical protein
MVPTRSTSSRQAPHRMLITFATAVLDDLSTVFNAKKAKP